jgi:N-formylglutamate deformylase
MQVRKILQGNTPLLVSIPHMGTYLPADIKQRLTPLGRTLPDTDWHLDQLYDFAPALGAGVLMSTHSRYVVDLNRAQEDTDLYPGQVKTGLCPLQTFDGDDIYLGGEAPDDVEKINRIAAYWLPYHEALAAEIARIKSVFGYAILYDAHSIRAEVPRLFEGRLWDLNLGTAHDSTCDPAMSQAALAAAALGDYSVVLNKRFVGGYITRGYGQPAEDVHAIQMELTWDLYMDAGAPYHYRADRADQLKPVLRAVLQSLLDWGRQRYGR